jgi:hypothetical protein
MTRSWDSLRKFLLSRPDAKEEARRLLRVLDRTGDFQLLEDSIAATLELQVRFALEGVKEAEEKQHTAEKEKSP